MARIIDLIWSLIKSIVFPLFAIIVIPPLVYLLVRGTSNVKLSLDPNDWIFIALFLTGFFIYAYLSIAVGFLMNQIFKGPINVDGCTPVYAKNGFLFYLVTCGLTAYACFYQRDFVDRVVENHLITLILCDVIGLIVALYLCWSGHDFEATNSDSENEIQMKNFYSEERQKEEREGDLFSFNIIFRFYRGMRFHPKILGVDAKQLTNCRFGLAFWQVIIWFFYFYNVDNNVPNNVLLFVNLLQTLYLAKFYWWETGYFNTLDIILDRGGFYINWGCCVMVPIFYTSTSWILANNQLEKDLDQVLIVFGLGVVFLIANYYTDYEKESFQAYRAAALDKVNQEESGTIVETIEKYDSVFYIKTKGGWKWLEERKEDNEIRSKLLVSGLWGVLKKLNYTFEIIFTFIWSAMACYFTLFEQKVFFFGLMYFIFLFFLLVLRCKRDDAKCEVKYGKLWKMYSERVPYYLVYGIY